MSNEILEKYEAEIEELNRSIRIMESEMEYCVEHGQHYDNSNLIKFHHMRLEKIKAYILAINTIDGESNG